MDDKTGGIVKTSRYYDFVLFSIKINADFRNTIVPVLMSEILPTLAVFKNGI